MHASATKTARCTCPREPILALSLISVYDARRVQDFDTDGNEAVIMYVKLPYWEQGIIKTIWIKRSRRSMNVHLNARRDIVNEIKALNKKLPAPQKLPQPKE